MPGPNTPPTRQLYPIPARALRAMAFTLPRPGDDEPESAWQDELQVALDTLAALDPRNPIEAILAIQMIAANAGAIDACRLAFEPGASESQAHRHRGPAPAEAAAEAAGRPAARLGRRSGRPRRGLAPGPGPPGGANPQRQS